MAISDKIVFISYSREDEKSAKRLYEDLKKAGAIPWRDKDEILAGQNWEIAIRKAINQSRYFIPLLSSNSTEKIGYIQNELKYAIENYDKIPESEIGIIPARLDNCEIPYEKLKALQSVDLFPDWANGVSQILRSMGITITDEKKGIQGDKQEWKMGLSENDWTKLLESIYRKKCIPFIGNGIYTWKFEDGKTLFPSTEKIIEQWKIEHKEIPLEDLYQLARVFVLEDSHKLARLAQFLEMDVNVTDPKQMLSDMLNKINLSDPTFQFLNNSPYNILANLELPIYMTTNYDKFLEDILDRYYNRKPRIEICRWNDNLSRYFEQEKSSSVFGKKHFELSESSPLVYHILGHIGIPQSMVLTERDYFEFVINLNKNEERYTIPSIIRRELIDSTLLFIGYSLEDINFRAVLQGFLSFQIFRKLSIAVQIPPVISTKEQLKMQRYLERYTHNMFQVSIYWGNTSDFMIDLDNRWEVFKKSAAVSRPISRRLEQ